MSFMEEWNRQQKALKDAEKQNRKVAASSWHNFRGRDKQQDFLQSQKAQQQEDKQKKKDVAKDLKSFRGGEIVDQQQEFQLNKSAQKKEELKRTTIPQPTHHFSGETDSQAAAHKKSQPTPDAQNIPVPENRKGNSSKPVIHTGRTREVVELDFNFGLIYDEEVLPPDQEDSALAAKYIVPNMLHRALKEAQAVGNPKPPPKIVGDVGEDDWFDKEGSIRYIIRGKIGCQLISTANTEEEEEKSSEDTKAEIQKHLKRHVSFRPIAPEDASKEKNKDLLVGDDGGRQWIRVREGRLGGLGITF